MKAAIITYGALLIVILAFPPIAAHIDGKGPAMFDQWVPVTKLFQKSAAEHYRTLDYQLWMFELFVALLIAGMVYLWNKPRP